MENDFDFTQQRSYIQRLNYYLNFETSSAIVYLIFLFISREITVLVLGVVAVIFIPYMLFVLIKEKKTGWLISFFIIIIVPLMLGLLFFSPEVKSMLLSNIALGTFFLYCFLLKMATRDWVSDENARKELDYKRKLKKMEDDIFFNRFDNLKK